MEKIIEFIVCGAILTALTGVVLFCLMLEVVMKETDKAQSGGFEHE